MNDSTSSVSSMLSIVTGGAPAGKGGKVMISLTTIAIIAIAIWLVVKYVKVRKNKQTPAPGQKQSKRNFWILMGVAAVFIIICVIAKKKGQ